MLWLVFSFVVPFASPVVSEIRTRRQLAQIDNFGLLASECFELLCNVHDTTNLAVSDPRVPSLIRPLKPMSVTADEDHVRMEFGPGWERFGFMFKRQVPDTNTWVLYRYDGKGWRELFRTNQPVKGEEITH